MTCDRCLAGIVVNGRCLSCRGGSMRKIATRPAEAAEPLTREEARELIEYHAIHASEAARCSVPDVALAHAAAAEALGTWVRHVGFVLADDDLAADYDVDGGGEGY